MGRGNTMSRSRYLVAVVAVGTLLAGCGGQPSSEAGAPTGSQRPVAVPTSTGSPQADPLALIGSWTVAEVDEGAGEILRLAPIEQGGLVLIGRCGVLMGTWRADANGLFLVGVPEQVFPEGRGCPAGPQPTAAWLHQATAFRVEGDRPVLLDRQGRQVALLLPGAKVSPRPDLVPSFTKPPVVSAEARRALAPAAPVPAALTPARGDALLGRWVPLGRRSGPGRPFLELRDDGTWRGSDGCNGQGGRWVAGPDGALLATSGPSTAIGCDNVLVGNWLSSASRAGLDGEVLVFLDAQGNETGRLRRDR